MKIAFYANHPKWGGLANNGGTNTILKSARVLRGMHHSVSVVTGSDKFTYFKHPKCVKAIPANTEVCIAVGIHDIEPMLKDAPQNAKLFYWMREYPLWKMERKDIYKILNRFTRHGKIICNASWLQYKLNRRKIPSTLCFAGLDTDVFTPDPNRIIGKELPITIGALYHKQHKTKNYEFFRQLKSQLTGSKYSFIEVGREVLSDVQMAEQYRACDIWFSPTELEGFHNCSAEAALCGALLVRSNSTGGGQGDYSTVNNSMIYEADNLGSAIVAIERAIFSRAKDLRNDILKLIGDRKTNMKNFLKIIE